MNNRPHLSESEMEARGLLVKAANEMMAGTLPFNEGAVQILRLRGKVGGVSEQDEDFLVFSAIASETDHLPLRAQFHLWNQESLTKLEPEFEQVQLWASQFAGEACTNLLRRFELPRRS
ncbi:MAG: hypothetical protein K0M67_15125 [Thiobacillus sp.]|nr:hypothetical protein [Thiobacillus sp.]